MGIVENTLARMYVTLKAAGDRRNGGPVRFGPMPFTARQAAWDMPSYDVISNQLKAYSVFSWVNFAVNRISESCAGAALNVLELEGEDKTQVKNHEFEQLLRRPSPKISPFMLMQGTFASLELTGNAYWYVAFNGLGEPAELWPLRSDWCRPVPHEHEYVSGYVYTVDGMEMALEAREVVHFRNWHPTNSYLGFSTIEALAYQLEGDQGAVRWNTKYFSRDKAIPAGVVSIKEMVSNADYERIKQEWYDSYGGTDRKTAIIRGGALEWLPIQPPQKDMEFLELRDFTKEEVMLAFGIPPGKFDKQATQANAITADATWKNDTLWPKLIRVAQQVTLELVQPFYGEQYLAEYEDIRPQNRELQIEELKVVAEGNVGEPILTTDEIRNRYFDLGSWAEALAEMELLEESEPEGEPEPPAFEEPEDEESAADAKSKWKRKALAALKRGKSAGVRFKTTAIPAREQMLIREALSQANSIEEVKAAFAVGFPVADWQGYP